MEDFSLHILDIVENSLSAGARSVVITIEEDARHDLFRLEIKDDGKGMDEDMVKKVTDPFYTTKTVRRIGLGLSLLKQASEECEGKFSIASKEGEGTTVTASFRHSHIDRKPLGDIAATFVVLIAGHPRIDFVLEYKKNDYSYHFDTAEIKRDLGEVPISSPGVLGIIRGEIDSGLLG